MAQEPHILQAEINKIEASHRSVFVAGWRPFIGWVCGVAMASNFLLMPYLVAFIDVQPLDLTVMMPVLMGMLGLGTMRSVEKVKNVAREK